MDTLKEKTTQHLMLKQQITCLTKDYNLTPDEQAKLSHDIADVLLTSWDLKTSESMVWGNTWHKESM